jgi:ribonuclease BN (tRNA processing enzyme)
MKLTVLGCLGAYPHLDHGTTAYLLESNGYNLMIDCGSMAVSSLEHHLKPTCLDAVILSHYHYDHIADIGVLTYYRQLWPKDDWDGAILKIFGHGEDEWHFNDLTMEGVTQAKAYDPEGTLKVGPFDITFLRTIHPVTCFAMRIVERRTGKVLVYTGDSGYKEEFLSFSKDADLFLADTYLFEGNENHKAHFTSLETGRIAQTAKVKKVVLTHLPQHGDLELLKEQAQRAAGEDIPVELAAVDKVFEI